MGIDYSGPGGTCNRDLATGIRYGIIPMHRLNEFAYDSFNSEYDPSCPACGDELPDDFDTYADDAICEACGEDLHGKHDSIFPDEPSRTVLDEPGYEGFLDSSGDVWVTKSPYYTLAGFCSPCAPGACYLLTRVDDAKAYCLGPDWFEGKPPYPIFRVDDDSEVTSDDT